MQKIILEHVDNSELELAICQEITKKLGDDWMERLVAKMDSGVEIVYSLMSDEENRVIIETHKEYNVDVFSVEDCSEQINSMYIENVLNKFLEEFSEFDNEVFMVNFMELLSADTVLDKISKGGLKNLNFTEINILKNV